MLDAQSDTFGPLRLVLRLKPKTLGRIISEDYIMVSGLNLQTETFLCFILVIVSDLGFKLQNPTIGVEILSEASAISIINLIYKRGEITTVTLRDEIPGGFDRLKKVANTLAEADLVAIDVQEKPHLMRTYTLTKKGKKVGEFLNQIDQVIRS